ncbi:MAG: hypothetical protein DRQ55_10675 [Planctomycetota bacterium]|nr:MAG: hypothetical protein DRQ55_10675 [Planctomycetota bacterium]
MTRQLLAALTLGLVASLAVPARAQVPSGDLAQLLPTSTVLFAQVDQLEKLALLDPDGAMQKLAGHEAVKAAFEELYGFFGDFEDEEMLLALDLEADELARLFPGRIMFALPEVVLEESDVKLGATTTVELRLDPSRGVVAMADFGGTEARLEELLENAAKLREEEPDVHQAAVLAEDVDGARLFNLVEVSTEQEVDDSNWIALVGELLIISSKEDTLLDFVDLANNGAPEGDRLSDDPRYLETLDRVGAHDALLYANLGELLPLVNDLLESKLKQQGMSVAMFLRPEDLIAALRLDAMESAFAALRVDDDEAGLVFGMTHADTEYGLHTLLTYGASGVELPSYFSSDFHSGSISNYDIGAAWEMFDKLLLKASPTGHGMLRGQIDQLEDSSFPLRDALLTNLDSYLVEILGYPEATVAGPDDYPTQAYVIKVKDPRTLKEALSALAGEQTSDEPVEFMNESIHVLPLPAGLAPGQGQAELAFAVVGNDLVVSLGERKMVENVIAHIKNPGESLLEDEDLMDAFDALPSEDVVALGFVSVADTLQNLIRGSEGALGAQFGLVHDEDDLEHLLEVQQALDELPDVSGIHYYVVSKTYKSGDAFVVRMLLRPDLDPVL